MELPTLYTQLLCLDALAALQDGAHHSRLYFSTHRMVSPVRSRGENAESEWGGWVEPPGNLSKTCFYCWLENLLGEAWIPCECHTFAWKITQALPVFFFFFKSNFIFKVIFGCTGSWWLLQLFSSCGKWRLLSNCGAQASHCGGSLVAEHGP